MVSKENMPFLSSLIEENFSPKVTVSAATASGHGVFGLQWMTQASQRYLLLNNQEIRKNPNRYLKGSPALYILLNNKYSINTFAYSDLIFCKNKHGQPYELFASRQVMHLQLIYSYENYNFLNLCNRYRRKMSLSDNWGILDNEVINRYLRKIEHIDNKSHYLNIIRMQAVHHPYGWIGKGKMDMAYKTKYNFEWNSPSKTTWNAGLKKDIYQQNIINSYKNATRSADYQIWRIFERHKELGKINNTIFVIAGDHGHSLFDIPEPEDWNGHGFLPFAPIYSTLFLVKFPPQKNHKKAVKLASSHDVWPTVLGAMGLDSNKLSEHKFIKGKDLLKQKRTCSISFKPEFDMQIESNKPVALTKFSFVNEQIETLIFEAQSETSIKLLYRMDRNNKEVSRPSDFTSKDLKELIQKSYSDCLKELTDMEILKYFSI